MGRLLPLVALAWILSFATSQSLAATVTIDFDDLDGPDGSITSMEALGIRNDYHGFAWGAGYTSPETGQIVRYFERSPGYWDAYGPGWFLLVDGDNTIAFNGGEAPSLWIDFRAEVNVLSVSASTNFSRYLQQDPYYDAESVQFFGYDESDNLVGSGGPFTLSNPLERVRYLEIRADQGGKWFMVHEVVIQTVPVPASLPLLLSGVVGIAVLRKRKK